MQTTEPLVATQKSTRRWYRRKRFWLFGLLGAFALWLFVPSTYSAGDIRFSVRYSGTPGSLTFVVRDSLGAPLSGITVMSESDSGTSEEVSTDSNGIATIRPSESEVLAVRIAGREFRFSARNNIVHVFAPDCSFFGLTFQVSIGSERRS